MKTIWAWKEDRNEELEAICSDTEGLWCTKGVLGRDSP